MGRVDHFHLPASHIQWLSVERLGEAAQTGRDRELGWVGRRPHLGHGKLGFQAQPPSPRDLLFLGLNLSICTVGTPKDSEGREAASPGTDWSWERTC